MSKHPIHTLDTWEPNYRLGDGCAIKHGFAFKGDSMTTDASGNAPIVVNIVNFQYTGGFRFSETKIQRYLGAYPSEYELQPGDVLLVMTCQTPQGEILGVPGRIPADGRVYLHNQRMGLVVIKDSSKLDLSFLYYLFVSRDFNQHLFKTSTGTKILHTAPSRIEDFRFTRPPLQTQQQIANILSAYDNLIENNIRRIKILEQMAQMLYREWFVNFRFPGHKKVKMVESEMGLIPAGWVVRGLGEVAGVNELSVKTNNAPSTIAYVDIASVSTNSIDAVTKIPFAEAPSRARRIVREGDTIWSTVRPNRKSFAMILRPEPNMIVSTGFAVLTPHTIPYSYLYFATTTDEFADYLTNHATGAAYPAVNSGDFETARMLIPTTTLLDTFHLIIEPMLGLQQVLKERNTNLRTTRDLLLPKLVSGEVSVETIEEEALAETV